MKITKLNLTAFTIEDAPGLDPITVILRDLAPGKGKLVVECYGRAWSAYWGGMGERDVLTFVSQASTEYVVNRMLNGMRVSKLDEKYLTRIIDAVREVIHAHQT